MSDHLVDEGHLTGECYNCGAPMDEFGCTAGCQGDTDLDDQVSESVNSFIHIGGVPESREVRCPVCGDWYEDDGSGGSCCLPGYDTEIDLIEYHESLTKGEA